MRMPLQVAPVQRAIKRLFGGPGSVEEISTSREILCDTESGEHDAAFYLPNQFDRVTGTFYGTTRDLIESEIVRATTRTVLHHQTIAYHLKDVVVFGGSVYVRNLKLFVTSEQCDNDLLGLDRAAL